MSTQERSHLSQQVNALWRALQAAPDSTRLRDAYQHALRMWRLAAEMSTTKGGTQ